tara:strand:- start:394 stop:738 length:345 start_codon:yes stop_codon:yes gene_type:complete
MYKYKVKQTEIKSYFFKWFESEQVKVYTFNTYNNALIFALSEEIKQFTCIISGKVETTRKTFKNYYTLKQFQKHCLNNSMHFLNTQKCRLNEEQIANYYFYLIGSGKLTKLKKY